MNTMDKWNYIYEAYKNKINVHGKKTGFLTEQKP